MVEFDIFRKDLAESLLRHAEHRRALGVSNGKAAASIALYEHLAADVANLDLHVFLLYQLMLSHEHHAARYARRREELLSEIGVLYRPANATALVRWMTLRTVEEDRSAQTAEAWTRSALIHLRAYASAQNVCRRAKPRPWKAFHSIGGDIRASFGIVAPLLALQHVGLAVGQWRDRAVMNAHAAVPARVISAETTSGGKSAGSATNVVLEFQPSPSAGLCRVMQHSDFPPFAVEPGQSTTVVPRGPDCEMPLIPSRIGDPLQTFGLAAALLIGGLVCLKPWTWFGRPHVAPLVRPIWSLSSDGL